MPKCSSTRLVKEQASRSGNDWPIIIILNGTAQWDVYNWESIEPDTDTRWPISSGSTPFTLTREQSRQSIGVNGHTDAERERETTYRQLAIYVAKWRLFMWAICFMAPLGASQTNRKAHMWVHVRLQPSIYSHKHTDTHRRASTAALIPLGSLCLVN